MTRGSLTSMLAHDTFKIMLLGQHYVTTMDVIPLFSYRTGVVPLGILLGVMALLGSH